jgi:hypothetical protein
MRCAGHGRENQGKNASGMLFHEAQLKSTAISTNCQAPQCSFPSSQRKGPVSLLACLRMMVEYGLISTPVVAINEPRLVVKRSDIITNRT